MSDASSSEDEAMMVDDRFKLFLDDAISESGDEEGGIEDEDTSSDNDEETDGSSRYRSLLRNVDLEDQDDDLDDDDLLDDEVEDEFRRSSFSAPMPWPPAIASQQNDQNELNSGKKKKAGIIYLSSIPTGFNVARTITFFSQFGRVGRVFLQPDLKEKAKRRDKMALNFTEGWIEFVSKRAAKEVANKLNNVQVGGSKRSKSHDILWNIKYLPRFKWTHLSERLAYERASHTQKMRTEVFQAKREADFYRSNVEKSKRWTKRQKMSANNSTDEPMKLYEFRQKETDEFLRNKRIKNDEMACEMAATSTVSNSQKKNKKKKEKKLPQFDSPMATSSSKNQKKNVKNNFEGPPTKRARTRSSDRKDFLQSLFGAKP